MNLIYGKNYARAEDGTPIRSYDDDHFDLLLGYDKEPIGARLNSTRVALVKKYMKKGFILDYGCGAGNFMRAISNLPGMVCFGFDVMDKSVSMLKETNRYSDSIEEYDYVSMWDVIEHLERPMDLLDEVKIGCTLFMSVPIVRSFDALKEWKHYRPNEHLHYWNFTGFGEFMKEAGFMCLEHNTKETDAGREDIDTFVFKKILQRT